jgi:hypothetical protein
MSDQPQPIPDEQYPCPWRRREVIGLATPWVRIYALCEVDMTIRYVGKTSQWLGERHKQHIRDAKIGKRRPVHYWLRREMAAGRGLTIKLLENVAPDADWRDRERYWIAHLCSQDARLLNLTDGGEGLHGMRHSKEHIEKRAAAIRTGAHCNCEVCGARFWRKRNEIAQGHSRFCSRACSNHRHKGRGLFDA